MRARELLWELAYGKSLSKYKIEFLSQLIKNLNEDLSIIIFISSERKANISVCLVFCVCAGVCVNDEGFFVDKCLMMKIINKSCVLLFTIFIHFHTILFYLSFRFRFRSYNQNIMLFGKFALHIILLELANGFCFIFFRR